MLLFTLFAIPAVIISALLSKEPLRPFTLRRLECPMTTTKGSNIATVDFVKLKKMVESLQIAKCNYVICGNKKGRSDRPLDAGKAPSGLLNRINNHHWKNKVRECIELQMMHQQSTNIILWIIEGLFLKTKGDHKDIEDTMLQLIDENQLYSRSTHYNMQSTSDNIAVRARPDWYIEGVPSLRGRLNIRTEALNLGKKFEMTMGRLS